ncbi:hypothetical protein K505DRAFT_283612 [Melanomma pulvis-pyrius CBS 109.77]|uniref:PD-(D/E)XK nuclease-like domain-containing protein n=1 Tax=Melanomma pulvis-pyrius CBS 109.77 TaxID=1314802 RepID=A0A6A6X0K3_9PLEO|nr:hypothetical protein K505DRAFT_283612 [Melanomma pulvis-pyrius CBS 109.77]
MQYLYFSCCTDSLRAQFEEKEQLRPSMLSPTSAPTSHETSRLDDRDFEYVCEVRDSTVKYWANAHEAGWNSKIHQKILDRALKPYEDRYESHNVTTAMPIKAFMSAFKDDLKDPKVVDFVISHIPPSATKRNIQTLLRDELDNDELRTINQTAYIRYQPAFLAIKTKRGHNDELDANSKLAMWTTAWQVGVSRFTKPGIPCTPLPCIIVYGHVWELQWAVDTEDMVYFIKHPEPIGNTATIAGCYRLLAAIRYLVSVWSEEVFLPWFVENVVGEEEW